MIKTTRWIENVRDIYKKNEPQMYKDITIKEMINTLKRIFWLVGWLVFMAYHPLEVIQCQIHFYSNFYFKNNSV